ncbi:MAG: VanZ family protein [Chloroflexota bacterium]
MRHILNNDTAFSLMRAGLALGFTLLAVIAMLRPELQTIAGIPILKIAAQYHVSLLGHVLTFALMFTFWCWALIPHFQASAAPYIAALVVMTLGTVGEFLQSFIPGRYPSGADFIANVIGVLFAWSTWRLLVMVSKQQWRRLHI